MSGDLHRFARARTGDSQPEQPVSSQAVFKDLSSPGTVAFRKPKNVLSGMGSAPTPSGSGARAMQEQPKPPQLSLVQMAGAGASMGLADLKSSALPTGTGSLFAVGAAAAGGNRGSLLGASTLSGTPARTALTSLSLAPPSVMAASASMPVPSLSSSSTLGLLSTAPTPAVVASPAPVVASTAGVSADALERLVGEMIKKRFESYHEEVLELMADRVTNVYDSSEKYFYPRTDASKDFQAADARFQTVEGIVQPIPDRLDRIEAQIRSITDAQKQQEASIARFMAEVPKLVRSCVDGEIQNAQTTVGDTLRKEMVDAASVLGTAITETIKQRLRISMNAYGVKYDQRILDSTEPIGIRVSTLETALEAIQHSVGSMSAAASASTSTVVVPTPVLAPSTPAHAALATTAASTSGGSVSGGGSASPAPAASAASTSGGGGSGGGSGSPAPAPGAASTSGGGGSGGGSASTAPAPGAASTSGGGGSGGGSGPASPVLAPVSAGSTSPGGGAVAAGHSTAAVASISAGGIVGSPAAVETTSSLTAAAGGAGTVSGLSAPGTSDDEGSDDDGSDSGVVAAATTGISVSSFRELTTYLTDNGDVKMVEDLVEWARNLYRTHTSKDKTQSDMYDLLNNHVSLTPVSVLKTIPSTIQPSDTLDPAYIVPPKEEEAVEMIARIKRRFSGGTDAKNQFVDTHWNVVLSQVLVFKNDPAVAAISARLGSGPA